MSISNFILVTWLLGKDLFILKKVKISSLVFAFKNADLICVCIFLSFDSD